MTLMVIMAAMSARAQEGLAIEDTLDEGLPRAFTPEIYQAKCAVLFEHVFESFGDTGVPSLTGSRGPRRCRSTRHRAQGS